jgi:hypothetical protein
MHPIVKILLGAVLILLGIWWIFQGSMQYIGRSGVEDLKTVLNGVIPPFVALIGLFIVWLELDELKIEKELKHEERRSRRK